MKIEFDPVKRDRTLVGRGLDFQRAAEVFAGHHFTAQDTREAYTEARFNTGDLLDERQVLLVWTPRGAARRIISMRKANEREQARYARRSG